MGLGVVWVKVAEELGYEAFLAVWRTLSLNRDFMDKRNRVSIPDIGLLFHYQRNQCIRELAAHGLVPRQIQQRMLEDTGEKLSIFQVEHALRSAAR